MPTKPKRDNAYFLERLRDQHSQVHADLLAGRFKNATEAFRVAGLIKTKTPLQKLERAWKDASQNERDRFKIMIGCQPRGGAHTAPLGTSARGVPAAAPIAPTARLAAPVGHPVAVQANTTSGAVPATLRTLAAGRGRLTATERDNIREIMDQRKIELGQIMQEIGINSRNASLGYALRRGDEGSLTLDLLNLLRPWIAKNRRA